MEEATKETVIEELRNLFGINKTSKSKETNGRFLISKSEFEREEVISKLADYFGGNQKVKKWYCTISPITFVFTTFEVIEALEA